MQPATYWVCNFVNVNSSLICDVEEYIVGHYGFFAPLFITAKGSRQQRKGDVC